MHLKMKNLNIKSYICLSLALALCGLTIVFGDGDSLTVTNVESNEDADEAMKSPISPGTDLSLSSELSEDVSEEDMVYLAEGNQEAPANLKGNNGTYLPLSTLQMFGSWFHPAPPHHKHKHTNGSANIQKMKNASFINRLKKNKTAWKIYQERSKLRQEFLANQKNASNEALLPGRKAESWSPLKPAYSTLPKQDPEGSQAMATNPGKASAKKAAGDKPELLPRFGDGSTHKLSPAGDVTIPNSSPAENRGDTLPDDEDDIVPAAHILGGEDVFTSETMTKPDGGGAPHEIYAGGVTPERAIVSGEVDANALHQPTKYTKSAVPKAGWG